MSDQINRICEVMRSTLRGPFAALRGAHPTSGSASRFELASVGRGTVLERRRLALFRIGANSLHSILDTGVNRNFRVLQVLRNAHEYVRSLQ